MMLPNGDGGFEQFGIALAEIHRCGKELDQARVHAGDDDDALVGEAIGGEFLVLFAGDELTVVLEDF